MRKHQIEGRLFAVIAAVVLLFAATSFAADQPKLTIESPQNGATVQMTPGLGPVAIIKFKTDDFKIESLSKMHDDKKMDKMDHGNMGMDKMEHGNMSMAKMGHVHVTLDNADWYWVHSTSDPVVIAGLKPGQHTVKLELVGPDHKSTGVSQTVQFTMAGDSGMSGK